MLRQDSRNFPRASTFSVSVQPVGRQSAGTIAKDGAGVLPRTKQEHVCPSKPLFDRW